MKRLVIYFVLIFVSCAQNKNVNEDSFEAVIDNIQINYTVRGNGQIMLVGHLYSGKAGYEMTLKPLEKYFTMVYYDPRGTGKSSSPEALNQYDYSFIVEEIELLRQHLKTDKIWLFGHSDQSEIALEYAINFPEHVYRLILSGTHFVENQEKELIIKQEFESGRRKDKWFNQVCKDWDYMIQNNTKTDKYGRDLSYASLKWWCYDSVSSEKVIHVYNEISKAGRRKPIANQQPFSTKSEQEKLNKRIYDYQQFYHRIKVPILILQGKWDTNNPPELVEKLHQELPTSTLIWMENSGHFPWVEQPEESFDQIEKWLTENHIFK